MNCDHKTTREEIKEVYQVPLVGTVTTTAKKKVCPVRLYCSNQKGCASENRANSTMTDNDYITRPEYNARHDEIVQRISKVENTIEAWRQNFDGRFENINVKFDRVNDKIDASEKLLGNKLDNMKDNLGKSTVGNFRWGISLVIASIGSIASTFGILNLLHLLR